MSDLIRRQDAIEVIDAVLPVDPMKSEYAQGVACGAALAKIYVEQLPSAQPEQRWIPCKLLDHYYIKELKDCDNKSYLVTYKTKTGRRYVKKVNIYHGKIQSKVGGKVIAWMPLPDAYEEDD